MKLRNKILSGIFALLAIAVGITGVVFSHDSPCVAPSALAPDAQTMKAVMRRCYGSPDVLTLESVAKPVIADDEILVKVAVAAINPLDYHMMSGKPYIMRLSAGIGTPKNTRFGRDFAGVVESVGKNVRRFKPGDEVFGGANGTYAQYITVREEKSVAIKPANLTFEQAAALPVAAVTALQALRDHGRIQAGQKVLINGASGGVGTFAVQIAKSFGAEVTGVCSSRNVEMVRKLGADHVIDYTQEDFTKGTQRYDLIVDTVGNHDLSSVRRALTPGGRMVIVGGPKKNLWIGPLGYSFKAKMLSKFVEEEFVTFVARLPPEDLSMLADLALAGKLTPVIDQRYSLSDVPDAMRNQQEGHAQGKSVVSVESNPNGLETR